MELVVVGGALALVALRATVVERNRRTLAGRTLESYARARGYRFVAASRTGAQSPSVHGEKDDVPFTIDLFRLHGQLRTRVSAPVTRGRTPRLSVVQRGGLSRALGAREPGETPLDDPAFDRAYRVTGAEADDARAVLAEARRPLLLLDERADVWLACDGSRVTLTWAGVETAPIFLDAARNAVVIAASWHRPDAPYR